MAAMLPTQTILIVLAVLFVSTFIRSTLGFGDALLAMPLLALTVGIRTATPLVAFAASTIAAGILLGSWRQVDLKATWRLIVSTLVGIPLGLLLLRFAPETLVMRLLGTLLIAFGMYKLLAPQLPVLCSGGCAYVFGFFAGILGSAYNTNGPPVVIYSALQDWPPERFRATLQGYFFPTGLFILLGHGLAGLWTPQVFSLYAWALPGILLAVWLGGRLNQHIPPGRFDHVIYAALMVFGVVLWA